MKAFVGSRTALRRFRSFAVIHNPSPVFCHALSKRSFRLRGERNFSPCSDTKLTKRLDLDPQKRPAYSLPQIRKPD